MPIQELRVSGYRSIRSLRLKLGQVNVLTGPNGCGKSNLYNSIFLLAKAATGGFARVIAEEGGMASVLWAGQRKSRSVGSLRLEPVRMHLAVSTDQFSYELVAGLPKPSGSAFDLDAEIKEERVWMEDGGRSVVFFDRSASAVWIRDHSGSKTNFSGELHKTESVLSQLREPHLYPELSSLRSEMSGWRFYHHFRTDPESPLRRTQVGVYTPVLSHDGSDLAAALQTIFEIGDSNSLVDEIERAFEGARLIIGRGNEGLAVLLEMPGLKRPLNARELSDGTLRYFCLVAALLSPRPPSLLALNEPETSLHPDLLDPLARLIAKASRVTQLWITTHSLRLAELIGNYSREAPIQLELSNGETLRAGKNPG